MLSGRFAPSPTGPLHMGSLVTALASYLDITSQGGEWYIRIDDIDPPREAQGSRAHILRALTAHGLQSNQPIIYQSQSQARFKEALNLLKDQTFRCQCTRAQLAQTSIYPGYCRELNIDATDQTPTAIRLIVDQTEPIAINDTVQPALSVQPATDVGDFILVRKDGLWAYNFATAIDDGHDHTHILRGQDLHHTTVLQHLVREALNLPQPVYTHIPLLKFADGDKLSKQTHAPALSLAEPAKNLHAAMFYLGMHPPNQPAWDVAKWLDWGRQHWPLHQLPESLPIYGSNPILT